MGTALEARGVTVRIGPHTLVDSVDLPIDYGEFAAIVGPNGAGKSTLAAVLAGDRCPEEGEAWLDGQPIGQLSQRERAKQRAVLPQDCRVAFPFRAEQVVLMGRSPHQRRGYVCGPADYEAAAAAMEATDTTHLAKRPVPTLSGGEQARVALARVLAQDTPVIILDEPSASLDLQHQQQVLQLCRSLADEGRAVVAIVHDLNQASAANRVAILDHGRLVAHGPPDEVLSPDTVSQVFAVPVTVTTHPDDGRPIVLARHS